MASDAGSVLDTECQNSRIPTEFRYFQNRDKSWARRLRKLSKRVLGFDPAPSDDVAQAIGEMYYDADPLAEAFVDEVYMVQGFEAGRAMLDQALREGVGSVPDAPESLIALFEDLENDPEWVDRERVELGAKAFRRYGTDVFRFAGAITLQAYAENSVTKPLILTGAYAGDSTRNRFLETASFWIDVSEPLGMSQGAPGRVCALRVRVMHVFVRRRLMSHPEWNLEAWGVPISQSDALLTLMGGSFAPGFGLMAMGYRPTLDEIDAMMHFWRYVGHIMGVRPKWYPSSLREALQLSFVAAIKGVGKAGADGTHLCQSYAEAFQPRVAPDASLVDRALAHIEHRVHMGFTQFFLPPSTFRHHRLPSAGVFALWPVAQFPVVFAAETVRRVVPAFDGIRDRMARRSRRRWLAGHQAGKGAKFRPVEHWTR